MVPPPRSLELRVTSGHGCGQVQADADPGRLLRRHAVGVESGWFKLEDGLVRGWLDGWWLLDGDNWWLVIRRCLGTRQRHDVATGSTS